jgi:hypothetical protein
MIEIGSEIRASILTAITPLVVEAVTIPVADTQLNPNQSPVAYRSGQAYVIISDQFEAETSGNNCSDRQNVSVTIDIITKFPAGSGGKLACEKISGVIKTGLTNVIAPVGFQILGSNMDSSTILIEQGATQIAFRKVLRYTFDVYG